MRFSSTLMLVALSATAISIPAQQKNDAGMGTVKRIFQVSNPPAVRDGLIIGICHLNGLYYVSGRGDGVNRLIYEYDTSGTLLRQFIPTSVQVTTNGCRDMATDGTSIIAGSALGVVVFDLNGAPVNTLQAANGPQAIVQPIAGPAWTLTGNMFRGCAYDPNGNGGNGSLWVSNQQAATSLDIFEIDLQGNILNQIANQGWEAYGLAMDPTTGNLWVNCLLDPTNGGGGPIFELDIATGLPTGAQFSQAHSDMHGGLDGVVGGDPGSYESHFDLVAINQSSPDIAAVHRVHLHPNFHGATEAYLEGDLNGGGYMVGGLGEFSAGNTLSWRINPGSNIANNGTFGWVIVNFLDDALCDGTTSVPIFGAPTPYPELRALTEFSTPFSLYRSILPTTAGAINSFVIPPSFFSDFDVIRLQALYLDVGLAITSHPLPFVASTEVFTHHFDEATASIVIEANGLNSAVSIGPTLPPPANGFFRVTNISGPPIVEVTFDFIRSTNPAMMSMDMRFDLDQSNMGDRFTAGNSLDPLCRGTYRNGSDTLTGLVYDGQNYPAFPCSPLANSGFQSLFVNSLSSNTSNAIRFRFTDFFPGETFEFDCDTDGGPGVDGASMAGLFVEVLLLDGRRLCGELRVDPLTPNRSVWGVK